MAYMNQEMKATIEPNVKAILKEYKVKGSLSVKDHCKLVLNISEGVIDFDIKKEETPGYIQVNPYWFKNHFNGIAKEFLTKIYDALNNGNHDNSNIQIDYFDVGWYVNVNIGKWNKPYNVIA